MLGRVFNVRLFSTILQNRYWDVIFRDKAAHYDVVILDWMFYLLAIQMNYVSRFLITKAI